MRKLRHVLPGKTYLITKKCVLDEFVIVPSRQVNEILLYCLAVAAERYQIDLHSFCFLSNHFHLVVTDAKGLLPDFMRHFLTNTSKALGRVLQRNGPVWSSERYSGVHLLDLDAAQRKVAYTLLNPVRAGLCGEAKEWPGLTSATFREGREVSCSRPGRGFRATGAFPEEARVRVVSVAGAYDAPVKSTRARIRRLVVQGERETAVERRQGRVARVDSILKTPRNRRSARPLKSIVPRFATLDHELLEAAILEDRKFHAEHRDAREAWTGGNHEAEFPPGSYGYCRFFGARSRAA